MTIESTIPLLQRTASRAARRLARACCALHRRPLALALACSVSAYCDVLAHDAAVADGIVWPVTNCDDAGPDSLRAAYANAIGGDEVDLTALTCSLITLTTGELVNTALGTITVRGPRASDGRATLTISGGHAGRVFHTAGSLVLDHLFIAAGSYHGPRGGGCIAAQISVRLDYSTLSDCMLSTTGASAALGGGIFAGGDVYLFGSTIAGSTAHAAAADSGGGAIWAPGTILLSASTISGNTASGDGSHLARGGGIYARGFFTSEYSTIANNRADTGGGVFAFDVGAGGVNRILIDNSTISGNEANAWAGGLMVAPAPLSLAIRSSTITGNRVPGGSFGGAYLAGAATVDGTILAGNTVSDGLQESDLGGAAGTTITGANNLIRASSLPVPGDTVTLDPMLGPLQDNGGRTATHALPAGSPAIDHGSNVSGRTVDQRLDDTRGHVFMRVVGPGPDIGAFEFGADRIFANGFE
jgi:hypothetical protein